MAKQLKLTPNMLDKMVKDFENKVKRALLTNGKIEVLQEFPKDDRCATLYVTPNAWAKTRCLVNKFSTEIAWHGLIDRLNNTTWLLTDILVYPHEASAATITADYEEYDDWLDNLSDAVFKKLKFHGHSHVNMGTTPSKTDMTLRNDIVSQMIDKKGDNVFYVFFITNKSGNSNTEIYDISNNALYSTDDNSLKVTVMFDNGQIEKELISEAQELVKSNTFAAAKKSTKTNKISYDKEDDGELEIDDDEVWKAYYKYYGR